MTCAYDSVIGYDKGVPPLGTASSPKSASSITMRLLLEKLGDHSLTVIGAYGGPFDLGSS